MPEPVKIVVVAETEAAAAKLQDFVQGYGSQLTSKIKETTKASQELSEGLGSNRMALMELGHVGRSMADGLMAGISPLRMLAMESPRIAQAASTMGFSLASLTPYLVAAGAAAAVLGSEWYYFMGGVEDSTAKTEELVKELDKIPALLEKIALFRKAGLVSPTSEQEAKDYLSGKKPLFVNAAGDVTPDGKAEQVEEFYRTGDPFQDQTTHLVDKPPTPLDPTSPDDRKKIAAYAEELTFQKIVSTEQTKALADYKEKLQKAHEQRLSQIDQEKAALADKAQKEIDAIALVKGQGGQLVGKNLSADESQAIADIKYGLQQKLLAIDLKERENMEREFQRHVSEQAAEDKKLVADQDRQLNDAVIALREQTTDKTKALFQDEYAARVVLAKQQLDACLIDEDTYTHKVVEASRERAAGEKAWRAELDKIAQLKREIAVGESEAKIRAIQGSPLLTNDQKNAQLLPEYLKLNSGSPGRIADLQAKQSATSDEAAQLEYEKKIKDEMRQQAELQNKIYEIQSSHSFSEQLKQAVVHMRNVQTAAQEVGSALERIHDKLQNSLTQGLTGLVMGTKTWQQALSEIYSGVLQQIAQELVQLFVEQVVMKEILNTITGGGSGLIGGIGSLLGFADGGRPPMGQYSLVGERGPELFVPDSAGTILPADQTAALMSGGGGGSKIHNAIYFDHQQMINVLERSDAHEKYIVNVMQKNVHRIQR